MYSGVTIQQQSSHTETSSEIHRTQKVVRSLHCSPLLCELIGTEFKMRGGEQSVIGTECTGKVAAGSDGV